jgi:hypothetical protein
MNRCKQNKTGLISWKINIIARWREQEIRTARMKQAKLEGKPGKAQARHVILHMTA